MNQTGPWDSSTHPIELQQSERWCRDHFCNSTANVFLSGVCFLIYTTHIFLKVYNPSYLDLTYFLIHPNSTFTDSKNGSIPQMTHSIFYWAIFLCRHKICGCGRLEPKKPIYFYSQGGGGGVIRFECNPVTVFLKKFKLYQ